MDFYFKKANDYYNKKDYRTALSHYQSARKLAVNNFTPDNILKIDRRINDIQKLGI